MTMLQDGDGAPANNFPTLFAEYSRLLKVQMDRMVKVVDTDLAAMNAELRRLGMPTIAPPCPVGQTCRVVP
jgi:hypothetical protein